MLGILDYGLARTADLFIKHAIAPAVNVKAPVSFLEESTGSLEESGDAILKIVPNSETKVKPMKELLVLSIWSLLAMPLSIKEG